METERLFNNEGNEKGRKGNEKGNEGKEKERKRTSTVRLYFFRHGDKVSDRTIPDQKTPLTSRGREQAVRASREKSGEHRINILQSVAFGSPRVRTQHTAGLVMAGSEEGITGDETFEELKEKLNKGLGFGGK